MESGLEFGTQPLDEVMTRLGITQAALVRASTEQLTHKMVAKGRKGRRLTLNAKLKILRALNRLSAGKAFGLKQLFNY